jgi:hypothetical protein
MGLRTTFCPQEWSSALVMAGFVGWRTLDFDGCIDFRSCRFWPEEA